jgi:SAM-dependent methyltransferase
LAEFTGERVVPGQVDDDLLNEHLARYAFATRLCRRRRVLDAGCGTGYGTAELARFAHSVTGIDSSEEAVAYAREHYRFPNLGFQQGDCVALPLPDASVDLVTAFEVIEHLPDWGGFLREVRRVLTADGQLLVSTPNRLYYEETRRQAGPNPYHVHEFVYEEFRQALLEVFPDVRMFLENHAEGVVFQPAGGAQALSAEVRVEGEAAPDDSHFFVAVCATRQQTGAPTFVYMPRSGNVLREREQHIAKLEKELDQKNTWLESAKRDLAALNDEHQKLLKMFRNQQEELEARNRWAQQLNDQLQESGKRVNALQDELAAEQNAGRDIAAAYEEQVAGLQRENEAKTQWALQTEERLTSELNARSEELTKCVEVLHEAEANLESRTRWALDLEAETKRLERELAMVTASRWFKLGRRFGLGPTLAGEKRA